MQRRADRAKTPVLLHHADDRAAALKHAQPLLGWLVVDGETALPWSVFQKLVTPALVRPHNRGGKVFADYPHAEVLERSWQALAKVMDFKSSDIFAEAVFSHCTSAWFQPHLQKGHWKDGQRWKDVRLLWCKGILDVRHLL